MQTVSDLGLAELAQRLRRGSLQLRVGPYNYNLQSSLALIHQGIQTLYCDFPIAGDNEFSDYRVAMDYNGWLARLRGRTDFFFDHQRPFTPIPKRQAYAFVEWGMNWCVSIHANEYLKLHSAVVAKEGRGIIMPGVPGAGKSTLCAALGLENWRILSDEHALVRPGTTEVVPLCRPVSLKNESIDVIRSFSRDAVLGPLSEDTHKGSVAHMKADLTSDSHDTKPLPVHHMIFPRYSKDEPQVLRPRHKTASFILAAYHSFNYSLMGAAGFEAMKTLIEGVECHDLVYHDLDWAIKSLEELQLGTANQ